ncbi:MAG: hypothetical protein GXO83_05565 [Chlorobi bacterium]|nr:hypothetical protein [Chlorobiota bacterium]
MRRSIIISLLIVFLIFSGMNRVQGQLVFSGYLNNMQDVMFEKVGASWIHDNLIHNRLQLKWYANTYITADVEMRNRFFYGTSLNIPGYTDLFGRDNGWMDLSFNVSTGTSYILNSMIDRAWLNFQFNKLEIRVGRQRINWGQTYVWNPNDIFNAYSFFDIDYPEKPGSDAVRIRYFPGTSSGVEITAKVDGNNKVTAASRFNISPGNFDLQYFAGILNSTDWVTGMGWSGNIGGAGFKGEVSLFQPKDSTWGNGDIMLSLDADYVFKNSLYLQFEFLYSSIDYRFSSFTDFYFMPLSVKTIAFTDFNIFGQVSYPFTPLINGTFSAIYYPSINGMFLGPSLSASLMENLDLSFFLQYFDGEFNPDTGRQKITIGFLRLKWSF